jgi:hypothetical protein
MASDREVVAPIHTLVVPNIAVGTGVTVTVIFVEQPVPNVYTIVAVEDGKPELTPPTMPVLEVTVATAGFRLLQVPPPVASLSEVVW